MCEKGVVRRELAGEQHPCAGCCMLGDEGCRIQAWDDVPLDRRNGRCVAMLDYERWSSCVEE